MGKRKKISDRLRFEVFKRDNFMCRYCGRRPPEVELELDHVDAHANGGEDTAENFVTSCDQCNAGKSNVPVPARALPAITPERLAELQASVERQRVYVALRAESERLIEADAETFLIEWDDLVDASAPHETSIKNALREQSLDDLRGALTSTSAKWNAGGLARSEAVPYFFGCLRGRARDKQAKPLEVVVLTHDRSTLRLLIDRPELAPRAVAALTVDAFLDLDDKIVFASIKWLVDNHEPVNVECVRGVMFAHVPQPATEAHFVEMNATLDRLMGAGVQ